MSENFNKTILREQDTINQILEASDLLSYPVVRTLGPEGLPILLQRDGQLPINTKDGVTVANSICIKDQSLDTIVQSIKEAANKTNKETGDGTTTAILLAHAFIKEGFKLISLGLVKPQELNYLIREKVKEIEDWLEEIARPIETEKQQMDVALISSNNDQEIASKVVEAINRAGQDGFVTLQEGLGTEIEIEHIEGFRIDGGFDKFGTIGLSFITHDEKQAAVCDEPAILFYDGELNDANDLGEFLLSFTKNGTVWPSSILVMAHNFSGQILNMVVKNRQNHIPIFLLKTPFVGSSHSARPLAMRDLAVFTGGQVIKGTANVLSQLSKEPNHDWDNYLGYCKKVEIFRYNSIFYEGYGMEEDKQKYLEVLKEQLKNAKEESEWDEDFVKTRIGSLTGGVVVLYVGGRTDLEIRERKDRVEDALFATRAAIEQGILPGGGCAFYYVTTLLGNTMIDEFFKRVLQYPIKQIFMNAGISYEIILDKIVKQMTDNPYYGYNVKTKEFVNNMLEGGVIDPLKVTMSALYNAISIATQMLTCGGVVCHESLREKSNVVQI